MSHLYLPDPGARYGVCSKCGEREGHANHIKTNDIISNFIENGSKENLIAAIKQRSDNVSDRDHDHTHEIESISNYLRAVTLRLHETDIGNADAAVLHHAEIVLRSMRQGASVTVAADRVYSAGVLRPSRAL